MSWEVRSDLDPEPEGFRVERGSKDGGDLEVAADHIRDYGLACLIEAAMNFRDDTVE